MKFQTKQKRKTYSDSLKINYLHEAIKISLTKKNIPYKIPYRDRQMSRWKAMKNRVAFGVVGKRGEGNRESK